MSALSRELAFQLHEFLSTESLLTRERYRDHSREGIDAVLEAAERVAADFFAPHYSVADQNEPKLTGAGVTTISDTGRAWGAFAEAGFLSAHWDVEDGGIALPETVFRAALAHFFAANVATAGYPFLTIGAANLLRAFGSEELKGLYLPGLGTGESAGTMALTEPGQGSSLGDIKTLATSQPDGTYRLTGQKMFISGGDQDITRNIIHMVLARIKGEPPGTKGISLFLVPKFLVGPDGKPIEQNDVALAGLLHKMGWRNTTSTVLSFGGNEGAVGWLLGEKNRGLAHMFHLMNEARIGVGLIASCLAYRGFTESLAFAKERPQGRRPSNKDPLAPQAKLIEHADVRRLLLAQKAYAEGALGLCLIASAWFEDQHTHPDEEARRRAGQLLDLITPVVKSWPARYGCHSNDMAIQVLGGSGYTREYPLEQLYRDQRLNPIHEGAEAIHGIDLLGRKVGHAGGAGLRFFLEKLRYDAQHAPESLSQQAHKLTLAADALENVTRMLLETVSRDPDLGLANANLYLDFFGRVAVAWVWIKQATVAANALASGSCADKGYYLGKIQAARYFFDWELPQTMQHLDLLRSLNRVPLDMQAEWFV